MAHIEKQRPSIRRYQFANARRDAGPYGMPPSAARRNLIPQG